jgi:hypothetical protein
MFCSIPTNKNPIKVEEDWLIGKSIKDYRIYLFSAFSQAKHRYTIRKLEVNLAFQELHDLLFL